jgi:hypothetical protein
MSPTSAAGAIVKAALATPRSTDSTEGHAGECARSALTDAKVHR